MSKGPVLILGAHSDIAIALAQHFAAKNHPIQLAARRAEALEAKRLDIARRHTVTVSIHEFDALATQTHARFVDTLPDLPEIAICVVGYMGRQAESEQDHTAAALVMRSNFEGPASILAALANRFEKRKSGILVGISSVAGVRGRASNYVYGAAKAGFSAFLSGLRNRLAKRNVHVMTVLPGFVNTKMTKDMKLPKHLTAEPSDVADAIGKAIKRKKNILYVRPVWRVIMYSIARIPEFAFKKMRL